MATCRRATFRYDPPRLSEGDSQPDAMCDAWQIGSPPGHEKLSVLSVYLFDLILPHYVDTLDT